MPNPAASPLNGEQRDVYQQLFGERYVAVQAQPLTPSRRIRRQQKFRPKQGHTNADIQLVSALAERQRRLEGVRITKAHKGR